MISKLFAIIVGHCFDTVGQRLKTRDDCLTDQVGRFAGDVGEDCKSTFAFNQRHDGLFMTRPDNRIAFPVTYLTAGFNRSRTLGNGAPANDLPPTAFAAGIAFTPFLLATQMFPQRTALSLVCVNMLVNRFVTNRQGSCNLLRAPLKFELLSDLGSRSWINLKGVAARLRSFLAKQIRLSRAITAQTRITSDFPTDSRLMPTQYLRNGLDALFRFHKCINLITFSLAEMFVAHKVTLTWRSGNLRC